MRLVVHDYSGHPGQVHLSRELARRGHHVEHQFCASYRTGRGATERRPGDPETFRVRPLTLGSEFRRYAPLRRVGQELEYARVAAHALLAAKPDVAVLSNVPLLALIVLTTILRRRDVPYVFWQQDVYSAAISAVARRRFGFAGDVIGWAARWAERCVARGSAAVVPISETFIEQLDAWGVPATKVTVIPNWAAIDEMPLRPRDNAWACEHDLVGRPVVMYAGTLGLKHDPSMLVRMATALPAEARLVVVSEGQGRDWLAQECAGLSTLVLLDYQPYASLPDVLASADVLVMVLESDASRYSVPSKVLNYFCAGRPVVGLIPSSNAAARVIETTSTGIVFEPGDIGRASAALVGLFSDHESRAAMGTAARAYAETTFDVRLVGDKFEFILGAVCERRTESVRRRTPSVAHAVHGAVAAAHLGRAS